MFLQPAFASPEHPWLFELHVGPSGTDASISDADIGAGFEFGGSIAYHFMDNRVGPYFGWSINGFEADSNAIPDLEAIIYRRVSLGVSYQDSNTEANWGFYVRGGVTSGQIQLDDDDNDKLADSGSGTGLEATTGLTFDLKNNWDLSAGIAYSSLSENLDDVTGDSNADIDAFTLFIGWRLGF